MKILDIAGLQYFWTKIKALLSGKADDGDVVHKAGAETVTGLKTFSGEPPHATASVVHGLEIRDPSTDREQTYNVNHISQILFCDVNGNYYGGDNDHHRLGLIQFNKSSADNHNMSLAVYKRNGAIIDRAEIIVSITSDHVPFAIAPSTLASRNNGTDIVTRDWIPNDTRIVHTTGDESISGLKYFGNEYTASPNTYPANKSSALYINDVSLVKGVVPSTAARRFINLLFLDSTKRDVEHKGCLGGLSWRAPADGPTRADTDISMMCWKFVPEGDPDIRDTAAITVGYDADGVKHATAPSTSSARNNGTDIVTRDWIPNDTRIVHATGNETVAGEKTFSDNATIAKSSPMLILNDTGTNPDAHSDVYFNDASTTVACIRLYKSGNFQIGRASSAGGSWFNGGMITFTDDGSLYLRSMNAAGTLTCRLVLNAAGTLTYGGPEPAASDDSTKLATTEWVRDATGNFACNAATASKLGTSNVGSASNPIYLNAGVPTATDVRLNKCLDYLVSADGYVDIIKTYQSDNSNYRSCTVRCTNGNGYNEMLLGVHNEADGAPAGISIKNTNGSLTISASTPAASSNDSQIATTAFVKSQGYITSSGSITGTASNVTGVVAVANGGTGSSTKNFVDLSTEQNVDALKYFRQGMRVTNILDVNASNTCITRIQLTGSAPSYSDFRFQLGDSRVDDSTSYMYGCLRASPSDGMTLGTRYGSEQRWLYGPQVFLSASDGKFKLTARSGENGTSVQLIGSPNGTLTWNGQNIQTSSDERVKTPLSPVPDDVLDSWGGVEWGQFRYLDAVAEKGGAARLHLGLIAQQVSAAFAGEGLDACVYGILCHEEKAAVPERTDESGEVVSPAQDAVDLWMARYAEALCMEAAYQRRENARLKARVASLEERLAALEMKLS